jgi:hypothetical protein
MREGKGRYTPRQPNMDGLLYFEGEYRQDMREGEGVLVFES